jgi:hypothetical protein
MANGLPGRRSNLQRYGSNSVRLRFGDGNIVLGLDPAMDQLYEKINAIPHGLKFATVAKWLLTGAMMETALPPTEVEEMQKAAENIMKNFVVFDDEI